MQEFYSMTGSLVSFNMNLDRLDQLIPACTFFTGDEYSPGKDGSIWATSTLF